MGNLIKKIYVGTNQVRPVQETPFTPGANTLAYYPLTSTTTTSDQSGNNRNLSNRNVSFGTYQGVDCAYSNGRYQNLTSPTISFPKTLSFWAYWEGTFNTSGGTSTLAPIFTYGNGSTYKALAYNYRDNGKLECYVEGLGGAINSISGQWFNYVIVKDGDLKIYVNGSLVGTYTEGNPSDYAFYFFSFSTNPNGVDAYFGGLSDVIMESVGRSASKILNYYNSTKSIYGL